ncbi:hypothetical protein Pan14r_40360 [Crateriforma conspicua]|uniref:Uncharacterized protein n=1 Tax=Crateriforma conspicua TaxID=2527996 RepID=A0A5C5Y8Q2_9PLAN|nr:hypothetical protein Pan14r_40360 [Crateriforma conspicua]
MPPNTDSAPPTLAASMATPGGSGGVLISIAPDREHPLRCRRREPELRRLPPPNEPPWKDCLRWFASDFVTPAHPAAP